MSANPINTANSIDKVIFAVLFARDFTQSEHNKLLELQTVLKEELPSFLQPKTINSQIKEDNNIEQQVVESGLVLRKHMPNGRIEWQLEAIQNRAVVTCGLYDSWANVWEKVNSYLTHIVNCLDVQDLSVKAVHLQYVDIFMENEDDYSIAHVFNTSSKYLTECACSAGKLWHIEQGWFENDNDSEGKLLQALKMATQLRKDKVVTEITSMSQYQIQQDAKTDAAKINLLEKAEYKNIFVRLHDKNKEILKSLLHEDKSREIGLS